MNAEPTEEAANNAGVPDAIRWQVPKERWTHQWHRTRKELVHARIRIIVIGNAILLALYAVVWLGGITQLQAIGETLCAILISSSLLFLMLEWFAAKLPAREPPLIVMNEEGIWETGGDEPETFVAWPWVRRIRIIQDPEREDYLSLEMKVLGGAEWARDYETYRVPLPEQEPKMEGAISEGEVWAMMGRALDRHGIEWTQPSKVGQTEIELVHPPGAPTVRNDLPVDNQRLLLEPDRLP